jgi:hypothetical protein
MPIAISVNLFTSFIDALWSRLSSELGDRWLGRLVEIEHFAQILSSSCRDHRHETK